MRRKIRESPMRLGERYGEIKYRGGKVIQRWRGSSGYVHLFHLLTSYLSKAPRLYRAHAIAIDRGL